MGTEDNMKLKFGNRIKALRAIKNISQKEFAEGLGVDRRTVHFWESGKSGMSAENFINVSEFFGISTEELNPKNELKISV